MSRFFNGRDRDPETEPEEEKEDCVPGAEEEYADGARDAGEDVSGEEETESPCRSIFKKAPGRPSFVLAVIVNTFRTLVVLSLALMLSGLGAVVGIARAYVDTAPVLDVS